MFQMNQIIWHIAFCEVLYSYTCSGAKYQPLIQYRSHDVMGPELVHLLHLTQYLMDFEYHFIDNTVFKTAGDISWFMETFRELMVCHSSVWRNWYSYPASCLGFYLFVTSHMNIITLLSFLCHQRTPETSYNRFYGCYRTVTAGIIRTIIPQCTNRN